MTRVEYQGSAEPAVVIAGAGPTGLMLAAELALAGVQAALLERRPDQELVGQRALGFFARTIEVFDQRGIAERFLERAKTGQFGGFGWVRLDISDFPTRHNYGVGLAQRHIERVLADWVAELGVPIRYGTEMTAFSQDESGVTVSLSDGSTLRTRYLVGCDGGGSLVRKSAGIAFPGWEASFTSLIGEAEFAEEPPYGVHRDDGGLHSFAAPDEHGLTRVMVTEPRLGGAERPSLRDLSQALTAAFGTDYGLYSAAWISRFSDMARQAGTYRDRRVLLAGDAAHVHSPMGGQGLGVGVQDAVNLGWKLAQVVKGTAPETLLDTYHAERHPVAARVLHNTLAQVALTRTGARAEALRDIVTELLGMDEPRRRIAGMMTGLDIHYAGTGTKISTGTSTQVSTGTSTQVSTGTAADADTGAAESDAAAELHPLIGRRMPDLDLRTSAGDQRVFTLLHAARPVLLSFAEPGAFDLTGWSDRVRLAEAETAAAATWELPVLGPVPAPQAVLIRPDGYVAWAGGPADAGLADALAAWFGPA
ncbi:3-(3-hydroxy-phenyl)propionate hydroxylase [Catenulispora sp. GP43]|uniref:FAD-dependent monooxygenase n=1 Tax=Catenulispora sp. GP43 TaxID=3156263 RepID=UPI003516A145